MREGPTLANYKIAYPLSRIPRGGRIAEDRRVGQWRRVPQGSLRNRGDPADLLPEVLQAVRCGLECGELSPQYAAQCGHVRRMRPAGSAVAVGLSSSVVSGSNPVAPMNRGVSRWPLGCRRERPEASVKGHLRAFVTQRGSAASMLILCQARLHIIALNFRQDHSRMVCNRCRRSR